MANGENADISGTWADAGLFNKANHTANYKATEGTETHGEARVGK